MRVQLLLNQNTRESFRVGYSEGDRMVRMADKTIARYRHAMHSSVLEAVYRDNQHLDDSGPWYEGRSLSMGDVICLDDRAYAVERVGFRKLPNFQVPA